MTIFYGLIIIIAGSHGNISMKNKQTASMAYAGIIFSAALIINVISLIKKFSNVISLFSFGINLLSGIFLTKYLFYFISFNLSGGRFPISFIILIGVQILISGIIILSDINIITKALNNKS